MSDREYLVYAASSVGGLYKKILHFHNLTLGSAAHSGIQYSCVDLAGCAEETYTYIMIYILSGYTDILILHDYCIPKLSCLYICAYIYTHC